MAESNPNPTAGDELMAESNRNRTAEDDNERREGEGEGEREQVVLLNATRHKHELLLLEGLPAYTCSGCKEFGANIGYKCKIDYDSSSSSSSCHKFTLRHLCATLPDVFQHPFLSDATLKFRPKTLLYHQCSACSDVVKGYVFETERRDLRVHPLCMALPETLDFSRHAHHKLKVVTGDLKGKGYTCIACDTNIDSGGWRYRCEEVACKVYVDLSCAKIDIYGLSDCGIDRVAPISRNRSKSLGKSLATSLGKSLGTSLGKGFIDGAISSTCRGKSLATSFATLGEDFIDGAISFFTD